MKNETARREIDSCIQTLRFLENNFINDHGMFMNDKHPDNIEKIIKFLKDKRWIPVSEGLPPIGDEVIVTTVWGEVTKAERYGSGNEDWFIHEGATNAKTDDILAWMPLPESYNTESEDKK